MWCITGYLFWPRTGQRPLISNRRAVDSSVRRQLCAGSHPPSGIRLPKRLIILPASTIFLGLFGYALCIIGVYFGLVLWLRTCKTSTRRGTIISPRCHSFCWSSFSLHWPPITETSHDTLFTTPAVLAYCATVYLWVWLTAQEVISAMRPLLHRRRLPTGNCGSRSLCLRSTVDALFALVRSLILIWVFFDPNWSLAYQASALSYGLLALLWIGFALALLPLRFLSPAVRVWIYLEQQRTLYQLERLRRELGNLTSPLPWKPATWQENLLQPSYALYCTLIDILDRRSLLLARTQSHSQLSNALPRD